MGDLIAAAEFKPLVSPIQVPVGQQQAVAEVRIREIVAVVAAADQRPGKRAVPSGTVVSKSKVAGVGSAAERPCADQRRKSAYWDVGKVRVSTGGLRFAGEGALHHSIKIGVAAAGKKITADLVLSGDLRALGAEGLGVDRRSILHRGVAGGRQPESQQSRLGNEFHPVGKFVVEVGHG